MKPILFSTPMVQAILDGRKTMTRRVIKSSKIYYIDSEIDGEVFDNGEQYFDGYINFAWLKNGGKEYDLSVFSRYQVGDVLWVRETFSVISGNGKTPNDLDAIEYKADDEEQSMLLTAFKCWKPSIYMPKEYARIFLRVTNVRVEILQDISEEDCLAEGIYESDDNDCTGKYKAYTIKKPTIESGVFIDDKFNSAYEAFEWLWSSINGKGAWEENPYVFVYEFERIEKPN